MSDNREQRNSVFTQNTGGAPYNLPPGHFVSQQDKLRQDFGLEIPVEVIPLPSAGQVYGQESSLHLKEIIEIKAMTTKEEDILTSRALLKKGTVITELIKSCLIDKSINPNDMLVGDRNAVMVAIRITGYGAEYNAEVDCPACGTKNKNDFNLAELPLKRLEIPPVVQGQNVFEFLLPYSKKVVKFKFLTGKDEEEIMVLSEKQKKISPTDTSVTNNLMYSIISIDGIEDRSKIVNFIKSMPARDSLALRSYIRDNEPGIVMKQDFQCSNCGEVEEVSMPIGVNFLWPQSAK